MKPIVAILRDIDVGPVSDKLVAQDYRMTHVASTGRFLRRGNVTLLIGAKNQRAGAAIDVLRERCGPPDPG